MASIKKKGPTLLREERLRRKMTQDQAAKYLGIPQASISIYEIGQSMPGLKAALVIERKFGIPCEVWT